MKFAKVMKEYTGDEHKRYGGPDLSNKESLTKELKPLIPQLDKMSEKEIRDKFEETLTSEAAHVSENKRKYYRVQLAKQRNKIDLMQYICNIHLAGGKDAVISTNKKA